MTVNVWMDPHRDLLRGLRRRRGPWDGQQFAHDAKSKEFFEPVIKGIPMNIENAEIIPHKIGEYYWGSNGLWIWLPEGTRSRHRA